MTEQDERMTDEQRELTLEEQQKIATDLVHLLQSYLFQEQEMERKKVLALRQVLHYIVMTHFPFISDEVIQSIEQINGSLRLQALIAFVAMALDEEECTRLLGQTVALTA